MVTIRPLSMLKHQATSIHHAARPTLQTLHAKAKVHAIKALLQLQMLSTIRVIIKAPQLATHFPQPTLLQCLKQALLLQQRHPLYKTVMIV